MSDLRRKSDINRFQKSRIVQVGSGGTKFVTDVPEDTGRCVRLALSQTPLSRRPAPRSKREEQPTVLRRSGSNSVAGVWSAPAVIRTYTIANVTTGLVGGKLRRPSGQTHPVGSEIRSVQRFRPRSTRVQPCRRRRRKNQGQSAQQPAVGHNQPVVGMDQRGARIRTGFPSEFPVRNIPAVPDRQRVAINGGYTAQ